MYTEDHFLCPLGERIYYDNYIKSQFLITVCYGKSTNRHWMKARHSERRNQDSMIVESCRNLCPCHFLMTCHRNHGKLLGVH